MTTLQIIGLRGEFTFQEAVDHFLALGGDCILFDPSMVCGKAHIETAFEHAERAFAEGTNRARNILTETILFAACERQIGKALKKMGPRPNSKEMVAAILNVAGDLHLSDLHATRDDSLCDPSVEKAQNLGAELFEGVSPEDCVIEQVAMVDLLKP